MKNYHWFIVGEIRCLSVNDGGFIGNSEILFTNAPKEELIKVLQRFDVQPDNLPSTWTCLLIKTPSNVVLVDTGLGVGGKHGGNLLPTLHAEGIQPKDVDTVILTHAHADHIGGCVDGAGDPTFPNATYYMWHDEWSFWTGEASLKMVSEWAAGIARKKLPPLSHQIELIDTEAEIVPGVRIISAPGHTAGHIVVEIESHGEYLLNLADTALHPVQVEYPEWYSRLDYSPGQTVETRKTIYQHAANRNALVLAFHFHPFPSLGHIVRKGERWIWQSIEKTP
jgi:glyoxylase-like metal-dependent hydrolase (beta-lactamase superfamily II)